MRIGRCVDTEACSVIVVGVLMLTDFVTDSVVGSSWVEAIKVGGLTAAVFL